MPYKSKSDLPSRITDNLPRPAQELYKETYNRIFHESKAHNDLERARSAREKAWQAVLDRFGKEAQAWKRAAT